MLKTFLLSTLCATVCCSVVRLNSHTFEGTVQHRDVLVLFHTNWCKTCRLVRQEIESIADDLKLRNVIVAEVDAEANKDVAHEQYIYSFPTICLYKRGIKITFSGKRNRNHLFKFVVENV